MKIGVVLFVTDVSLSPAALARKCESLGFESIFMPEHTVIPVDWA
jgi:alkanesulfonate monooxygenase SsuD/methylene tetrahydromethanopterin reductase-like flavin-dependent oxidoreductase (luciferase family)